MDVRLTWAHPTRRSDGSNMPLAHVAGTRIEVSADGGQNYGALRTVAPSVLEYVQTELEFGTWFFRAITLDTFGQESEPAVGSIVLTPAPPGSPTNLELTRA